MSMTTTGQPQAWLPEQIGALIVQPVEQNSVAIQALGATTTSGAVDSYRVPIVKADPSAAWVAEGAEITPSDSDLDEDADTFHKLAGLTVISSELANDSAPDVAEQIGQGLARDIARKFDGAFFGSRAASTLAPRGLGDIAGIGTVTGPAAWTDLDPFAEAISNASQVGASLAAFVASPSDALALSKLKVQSGSNLPLLGADPTTPTKPVIAGVPLLTSSAVTAGTIWGLPADRVVIVLREDATVTRDESVFFTSDRVAIRAILRATVLYPHAAAIQRIQLGS